MRETMAGKDMYSKLCKSLQVQLSLIQRRPLQVI